MAVVAGEGHTAWLDESHQKALQQDVAEFLALQKSDYTGKNSYVFDKIMTNLADYLMYNFKVPKILLARRSFGQSAWE